VRYAAEGAGRLGRVAGGRDPGPDERGRRWRAGAGVSVGLALLAYAAGLGGLHIPHIGDEAVYLAIARKTAASGHWLPLETVQGLGQTKPPLLFWTGMVAGAWGAAWDLFRLRLPIVLFTFATAALAGWTAGRVARSARAGVLAAFSFLAFWSTFQYGRPFLTNLPETFFVFLPFAVALSKPTRLDGWPFWVLAGVSTGLACLVKSFALVVPVAVGFGAWLLVRRRGSFAAFLRRDLAKGILAAAIALGLFALWPLLDPHPRAILDQFVLGENVGKVGGGWLPGLVSPSHGAWTTLLGVFFNAGFLAPAVVWLAWDAWRRRRGWSEVETACWLLVLAFVVVFTLPSHRQSNYLLPAMPAVAVLLALSWERIPTPWLGATAFASAVAALLALLFQVGIAGSVLPAGAYAGWQIAIPAATVLLAGAVAIRPRFAPRTVHAIVFLVYLSIGAAIAPFDGDLGRYAPAELRRVAGETVWVPSNFRAREERHRFLLPGADVKPYPADRDDIARRLLAEGKTVAWSAPVGEAPPAGTDVLGGRFDLRSRQTPEEIRELVLERRFGVLVQREMLLRRADAGEDAPGGPR
jgi:4-amino-4-deoxy-L-arabinose transferase-like glycosyltransferase